MGFTSFPSFDMLALCLIGAAIVYELWGRLSFSIPKGRITRAQAKAMAEAGRVAEAQRRAETGEAEGSTPSNPVVAQKYTPPPVTAPHVTAPPRADAQPDRKSA